MRTYIYSVLRDNSNEEILAFLTMAAIILAVLLMGQITAEDTIPFNQ